MDIDGGEQNSTEMTENQTGTVISKIEVIFESMIDCLLEGKNEMVIYLKTRPKLRNSLQETDKHHPKLRSISFPSKNPREAWMFSALIRILELSHEALVTGVATTKRDIYYRDPKLFIKQSVVNRLVDDIAFTFGVDRDALNVIAAARGLVIGFITVIQYHFGAIDYSLESRGKLVPDCQKVKDIIIHNTNWILVIEKEATFQTLASSSYWKNSAAGTGIIITAKGYPDIRTRKFLNFLSSRYPQIPIYALVDFDPDGVGIMLTYKYGSINLSHEKNVKVSSIKWLGIKACHFSRTEAIPQKLLSLSARDRQFATKMMERDEFQENSADFDCKRQLQTMLFLNLKAEIQMLGNAESLSQWLDLMLLDSGAERHEVGKTNHGDRITASGLQK